MTALLAALSGDLGECGLYVEGEHKLNPVGQIALKAGPQVLRDVSQEVISQTVSHPLSNGQSRRRGSSRGEPSSSGRRYRPLRKH